VARIGHCVVGVAFKFVVHASHAPNPMKCRGSAGWTGGWVRGMEVQGPCSPTGAMGVSAGGQMACPCSQARARSGLWSVKGPNDTPKTRPPATDSSLCTKAPNVAGVYVCVSW